MTTPIECAEAIESFVKSRCGATGLLAHEQIEQKLAERAPEAASHIREMLDLLQDARQYITPTIGTHEEISEILGWCDCGYCTHVPKGNQR